MFFNKYDFMKLLKKRKMYTIDGFTIELSEDHNLPGFQKSFPMYDRFVPCLGELADVHSGGQKSAGGETLSPSFIIDIGANCGDTVAALIKHTLSDVLCIEPVPAYFGLLEKNISIMGREFSERIITLNAFVGCEEKNWTYKTEHGTAHMVETGHITNADIPTYSLPHVLQANGISDNQISLIKVDTDGYDADCIMSMGNILKEINPPIFWENYIENDEQLKSYNLLMDYLADSGYTTYYIFDNFGNYILETGSGGVKNINAYIDRIRQGFGARTFYYVDILAIKGSKEQYENVIRKYINKYA